MPPRTGLALMSHGTAILISSLTGLCNTPGFRMPQIFTDGVFLC